MQVVVNGWFANGLFTLWLSSIALAVLLYFIPKLTNAPLFSRSLALIGFWTLAAFGCWAGFYRGLPIPAWIISVGVAATAVLLIPLVATVSNLWMTMGTSTVKNPPLLGFFKSSLVFFAVAGVCAVFAGIIPQLRLTLFGEGLEQLALYGFVGLALFGAIHYIVPRLTGLASDKLIGANCWCSFLGIIIFAGAYLAGGTFLHRKFADGSVPFAEIMNAAKPFIRISTLGVLLLVLGNAAILLRSVLLVRAWCRTCCCVERPVASVKLKAARAAR